LTNTGIFCEIICDLVHIHPAAIKILVKNRGADGTILVTDSMRAAGLPDGDYNLGDTPVNVKDGAVRTADGVLAGSTATMAGCVRNIHQSAGVSLADAITMATETPAKALGIYGSVGSIDEGKCADIIAADENLNIKFAMTDGKVQFFE
jgi:N-acetylglucosamine-6-phosphate deacetylase